MVVEHEKERALAFPDGLDLFESHQGHDRYAHQHGVALDHNHEHIE